MIEAWFCSAQTYEHWVVVSKRLSLFDNECLAWRKEPSTKDKDSSFI